MAIINTRYSAPSEEQGERVIASNGTVEASVPWEYSAGARANHTRAVDALKARLGWGGRYVIGGQIEGAGYAFFEVVGG